MEDRLEELNNMDPASVTDPEEIPRLQTEIQLLNEKKAALERLEAHEKKEAADAAADALTSPSLVVTGSTTAPDGVTPILTYENQSLIDKYQGSLQELANQQERLNAATKELYAMEPDDEGYAKQEAIVESLQNAVDGYDKSVAQTRLDILALYESIKDVPEYADLAAEVAIVLEIDEESVSSTVNEAGNVAGQVSDALGNAVSGVLSDEAKESLNKQLDDVQSSISTLSSALENLQSGKLDFNAVIDLMQQFPELAPYVDLTAENFGDLADGLKKAIKNSPKALIKDLKELAKSEAITEDAAKSINGLIDYLEDIPTSGVEKVSDEFGVLKDSIDAAKQAHYELETALAEPDYDEGYNKRVNFFEGFQETHKEGEYGSKAYAEYKEYFGLAEMSSDEVGKWIKRNEKYFAEGKDGIVEFLKTVDSLDDAGEALSGIASFNSATGEFWYDVNALGQFADALGWTEEMLQDFIDKYRMYCEEWISRDAQDNLTEFLNAGIISDVGSQATIDLRSLIKYTGLSATEVYKLIDAMNELRNQQGLGDLVVINDLDAQIEKIERLGDDVSIEVGMVVDGEPAVVSIKTAADKIEEVLGEGWEAKLNSDDAEERMGSLLKLCAVLTDGEYEIDLDDNAASVIGNLKDLIGYLEYIEANKNQTVTVTYKSNGTPPKGSVGDNRFHTRYALGTKHAKDGPALLGDEYSPNGTPKPELVVSDGEAYIAGANGPEIRDLNAGDVVYTADETKKILGGRIVDRVIPAHAGGTASGLVGGGSGGSSGSSGSSKKPSVGNTKKPDSNTFEDLYAYHQHLLELERESLEDYLKWLSDAYKKAYKKGEIELQDYYNYEAEIFQGLQDLHNGYIQDVEHQIFLMEKRGASSDEIAALYRQMMDAAHAEAERLRADGLDENSNLIQSLQEQWWEYHDAIIEIQEDAAKKSADAYAAAIQDVEHQIFLLEQNNGANNEIIALYKQMMEMAHEEAERLRAAGYDDSSDEIQELQDQWWAYHDEIEKIRDDITENTKSAVDELVDYRIDMLKQQLEEEKDTLDAQLDELKDFYDKQKDMLREKYDEEKYLEEQAEKRKAVSDLEAELGYLKYDDSAWAQKRRAELEAELADARKELEDFEEENALDEVEKLLDHQYEEQAALIQDQIDALEEKLNDPEALFNQALADIKNSTEALYQEMVEYNAKFGDGNEETIRTFWEECFAALKDYEDLFGEAYSGVNMDNATGYVEQVGQVPTQGGGSTNTGSQTTPSPAPSTPSTPSTPAAPSLEKGSYVEVKDGVKWYETSDGTGSWGRAKSGKIKYISKSGTHRYNIDGAGWIRKQDIVGYAAGTSHATAGIHEFDENGDEVIFTSADGSKYRIFSDGEKVLNARAAEFLYDFANSHGNSMKNVWDSLVGSIIQQVRGIRAGDASVEISTGDIVIQGNADSRTVSEIRRAQRDHVSYILKEFNKLR